MLVRGDEFIKLVGLPTLLSAMIIKESSRKT